MFKTAIFLSVISVVILKASGLQCYVCYDCEELSDDYVTSCDSLVPTTTSTQPTSTSTTTPTTTTSTTPSTTTTSTESTTTSTTTTTTESTTTSTTTPSTTTTTTTNTTEAPSLRVSDYLEKGERADTTWECVRGTVSVNGSDVIVRGCAAGRTNETCTAFGLKSCSFCSTDKCNAAGSIQSSTFILAVLSFVYLIKEF